MSLSEARSFIGKLCFIRWHDRNGQENELLSAVYDVTHIPLYGGYLVTDTSDIPLSHVRFISLADATPKDVIATQPARELQLAA